jgi:hypothetical protein
MKMKSTHFGLLLLLSIAFTACNHDVTLRQEKRIIGDWEFDRVRYFSRNDVFNGDNITDDYDGVVLTFYENKTMEYKDNGQIFTGEWDLKIDYSGDDSEFELIAFLLDANTNETKIIVWDNFYFANQKMNATETFDDGERIVYRLEKW